MSNEIQQAMNTEENYELFCRNGRFISISPEQYDALIRIGVIQVFKGVKGNRITKYNTEACLRALQELDSFGGKGGI